MRLVKKTSIPTVVVAYTGLGIDTSVFCDKMSLMIVNRQQFSVCG